MTREEAIKVIRDNWPEGRVILQEALKTLVPELKESKDERIKRCIGMCLTDATEQRFEEFNTTIKDCLAWLEKQGEHKCDCKYVGCHVNDVKRWCHKKQAEILYEKCNTECSEYSKQGEKIDAIENFDTEFEKQVSHLIASTINKEYEYTSDFVKWTANTLLNYAKNELEKQVDKKKVDNVKSKFKIGDWVVYCNEDVDLITGIKDNGYLINKSGYIPFTCQGNMRLWTIQDAKDGDVLATKKGNPFIYDKNRYNNGLAYYYAGLDVNKELILKSPNNMLTHLGELRSVYPATKEQRDTLMKSMADAGYEWDAEKKELKKIEQEEDTELTDFESALFSAFSDAWQEYLSGKEVNVAKWTREHSAELLEVAREQKPAWSEEDENILNEFVASLKYSHEQGYNRQINWLKSLKNRVKLQPKQELSEDVEAAITLLKDIAEEQEEDYCPYNANDLRKAAQYLETCRPQPQWKPSDEQMEALWNAIPHIPNSEKDIDTITELSVLYNDLKKLKE